MLQILGKPTSINVRKVLWTCAEIGIDFDLLPYGSGFSPTDTPAFRALNPNALVPVIRDHAGDHASAFVLWESNTICRYLAGKHGRDDLLPVAAAQRAKVEQWMDWQATELNNAWRYAFMALVRQSPAHTDAAATARGVHEWTRHMTILDTQLHNTGAFVTGTGFTLADVVLGLSTHRWFATPLDATLRPDLPAVAAYYDRLSQRPGFMQHARNGHP